MLVFRIALTKYANALIASGRAARWNDNDVNVIYTSSSRSLCCLENVVHRSKLGLSANFSVMTIEIPDDVKMQTIDIATLPINWNNFTSMYLTQKLGNKWIQEGKFAVLRVPSSIVPDEFNYLINPLHADFKLINLLKVSSFLFDERIKN